MKNGNSSPLFWAFTSFVISFLIQTLFVSHFAVNVPFWDEWLNLPLFLKYDSGSLSWSDMFAQHNEHRIFIARLAFLGLYILFGQWNLLTEMVFSAFIVGVISAILGYTTRKIGFPYITIILSCLLLTSTIQWENILWGFQIQFYTLVLGYIISISAISLFDDISWKLIAIISIGCIISTFSISSGLISWANIVFLTFIKALFINGSVNEFLKNKNHIYKIVSLVAISIVVISIYLYDYHLPPGPQNDHRASNILDFLKWVIMAISYPVFINRKDLTHILLAIFEPFPIILAIYLRTRNSKYANRKKALLFLGISLFTITNIFVIGYGRSGIPSIPSRYATIFLWSSILYILSIVDLSHFFTESNYRFRYVTILFLSALTFQFLLVHTDAYISGLTEMQSQKVNREDAKQNIIRFLNDLSPNRTFVGFPIFPPQVEAEGYFDQSSLLQKLPPDMRPQAIDFNWKATGSAWVAGGVYPTTQPVQQRFQWGSWNQGDDPTGKLTSGSIYITEPFIEIPIAGYPNQNGNILTIISEEDSNRWISFSGSSPRESWQNWTVNVESFMNQKVRIVGIDNSTSKNGWFAVGKPYQINNSLWFFEYTLNHIDNIIKFIVIAILIILAFPKNIFLFIHEQKIITIIIFTLLILILLLCTFFYAKSRISQNDSFRVIHINQHDRSINLIDYVSQDIADGYSLKLTKNEMQLMPNTPIKVGPFSSLSKSCFYGEILLDAEASHHSEADGVNVSISIETGDNVIASNYFNITDSTKANVIIPLPSSTPFNIHIQTLERTNNFWDQTSWRALRISPC